MVNDFKDMKKMYVCSLQLGQKGSLSWEWLLVIGLGAWEGASIKRSLFKFKSSLAVDSGSESLDIPLYGLPLTGCQNRLKLKPKLKHIFIIIIDAVDAHGLCLSCSHVVYR